MAERRRALLLVGVAVVLAALAPPVHRAADEGLVAHMAQHVALLTIAPALLVAGSGLAPPRHRSALLAPVVVVHSAVMVGWHWPAPYAAAVSSDALHVLEHLSLLGVGMALWWALGIGSGDVDGSSVLALFAAGLPCTALGFAMTFARHAWYSPYPSLVDQQVAGVIMWAVAGGVYSVAGGALVVTWVARDRGVAA